MGNTLPSNKCKRIVQSSKNKSTPNLVYNKENTAPTSQRQKSFHSKTSIKLNSLEYQYSKISTKISEKAEIAFLNSVFKTHPIFSINDPDFNKNMKLKYFQKIKFTKGSKIYNINENPEYCFIIYTGEVILEKTNNNNSDNSICSINKNIILKEKDSFGEYELCNYISRQYNAKCSDNTDCILFLLEKDHFYDILQNQRRLYKTIITDFMTTNFPVLNYYTNIKESLIKDYAYFSKYYDKEEIFSYNCISVVINGELISSYNGEKTKTLRKGDYIGYKEVISNTYTGTVELTATKGLELMQIPISGISAALGDKEDIKQSLIFFVLATSFKRSPLLNSIDISVIRKILPLFTIKEYEPEQVIYKKGESLKGKIILMAEGNIYKHSNNNYEALRNNFLYEKSLILNNESTFLIEDLYGLPYTMIMESDFESIKQCLGHTLSEVLISNEKIKIIQESIAEILKYCKISNINTQKAKQLEKSVVYEKYATNYRIIEEGSNNLTYFYYIIKGKVNFYVKSKFIRILGVNSFFGLKALLTNSPVRTASAVTSSSVEVLKINAKDFMNLYFSNNQQMVAYFKTKINERDDTVELKDLENVRLLGKGGFGFVNLVKSKKTKCLYAIKAIPIKKVIHNDMYELISNERNLLRQLDHKFVLKNVLSFKNDEFVFLLNELIKGKTLAKVLKESGCLNKQTTLFYSASIMIVIKYLHSNCIIHRDIKPDNIMISENGYIKLIDFGISKKTSSYESRTHTIIGTPHYMAPEMIKGESYSNAVDFWAAGVSIYELFTGKVPFGHDLKDTMEIYNSVLNGTIHYPQNYSAEKDFQNLINNMLNRDLNVRLYGPDVNNANWFNSIDWDGIENMKIAAPMKSVYNEYEDKNKCGNYLMDLKLQVSNSKANDNNQIVINDHDIQKCKKWLEDF